MTGFTSKPSGGVNCKLKFWAVFQYLWVNIKKCSTMVSQVINHTDSLLIGSTYSNKFNLFFILTQNYSQFAVCSEKV